MSIEARKALVDHPNTIFRSQSQRDDLLDPAKTQTSLIALLVDICITKDMPIEFTAVRSDHHDDSELGEHCHAKGYAVDCWPLWNPREGAYLDARTGPPGDRFRSFLRAVDSSIWRYQIGLAGTAQSDTNMAAAGSTAFADDGADHVHIGSV